jgi:hypothetical protein
VLVQTLTRKHWQRHHCMAIESDFIVEPCNPHGDRT